MEITSFDVGIKNLAYCTLKYSPEKGSGNEFPITSWDVIDIINAKENSKANPKWSMTGCKKDAYFKTETKELCKIHSRDVENIERLYTVENTSFYEIAKLAIDKLDKLDFSNSTKIIIENQPKMASLKMKMIPMMLLNYFIIRYIVEKKDSKVEEVLFINATNKLTVYDGPFIECNLKGQYARNKFYSKEYCKYLIRNDITWSPFFQKYKKRDDLADCFLQGAWYLMNNYTGSKLVLSKEPEKIKIRIVEEVGNLEGGMKCEIIKNDDQQSEKLVPTGKYKLSLIKNNSTTKEVYINLNIQKYKSIRRGHKPHINKELYSLSEIKYFKDKKLPENQNLIKSIEFYFGSIDTFNSIDTL